MRPISRHVKVSLVLLGSLGLVCSCRHVLGTGQNDENPMLDDTGDGDLNGFFRANEPWMIGSPTFIASGNGAQTEFIVIHTPESNGRCLGLDPPASLRYVNGQLTLSAMFNDVESGGPCGVNVSGHAALCAPGRILDPPARCQLNDTEGTVNANGEESAPERTQIVRFAVCDEAPVSFDDFTEWTLSSLHFFGGTFLDDPGAIGAAVLFGGVGPTLQNGTVVTGVVQGTELIGCLDEMPQGTVLLSGSTLTIDTGLVGRNNAQGQGTAESCAVTFDGQMAYCATMDPAVFGTPGELTRVIRFEGNGRWTSDTEEGLFSVMYLGTVVGGGSGGVPPGVRVKGAATPIASPP